MAKKGFQGKGGSRSWNNNKKGKTTPDKKKDPFAKEKLSGCSFGLGGNRAATEFVKNKDFIINHIKKSYTQGSWVAKALTTGKPYDYETRHKPVLQKSNNTDDAQKKIENEQFKAEWQIMFTVYHKEVRIYNMDRAHALL